MSTCLSAVCLTRKTSVISYIKQHVREGPGARAACVQKYTRRLKQLNVRTLCPSQLYFGYSSQHSFSSSILSGLTPRIFRTVTDTSEHILFYFLVLLFFHFSTLVVGSDY